MKFRPVLAFVALALGSGLSSAYGCSTTPFTSGTAQGDPGTGGAPSSTGGSTSCPPVTCVTPGPSAILDYADLLATLKGGGRVRAVFDYTKCDLAGKPGPNALGAMSLDTFEWFGPKVVGNSKAYIAASENHLIGFQSSFVYDYVRARIFEDGKVTIDVQYLDPLTFAVSVDETFVCSISDGKTEGGATFFKTTP